MSFNLGKGLVGAASGLVAGGNWLSAGAGFLSGALGGANNAGTISGNIGNSALSGINAAAEADQIANYAEQTRHQSAMQWQSTLFDEMMDEKAEQMRQVNALRDLKMEQRKADNAITKKFITSITEG